MAQQNLVKVNVYSKGRIPWLNILGPRMDLSVSPTIYRLLKQDPNVEIYLVEEDPRLVKQVEKVEEVVETKVEVQIEEVKEEPKVELGDLINPSSGQDLGVDIDFLQGLEKEISTEKVETVEEEKVYENIDGIIEQRLEELPDEPDFEPTPLTEEDKADEPTEETKVNDLNDDGDIVYTVEQLTGMTKAQMKQILLDRGHENDEFTGRYHDTVEILIEKVLKTQ